MKNPLVVLLGFVTCSVLVPSLITLVSYKNVELTEKPESPVSINKTIKKSDIEDKGNKEEKNTVNYETVNKKAPIINVYNHITGKTEKMDMENYLCGVLAGEMSSEFDIEALKAQSVAARTYVVYKQEHGKSSKHKNAVVCTDYKHCQEYKSYDTLKKLNGEEWIKNKYSKIQEAVRGTKGQIITYNDKAILPLYFSTSSGKTENSEEVFSAKYPYLKYVESPYDKYSPKFASTLKISNTDFVKSLRRAYSTIVIDVNNLSKQVSITKRSDAGTVEKIKLGNKELTGKDIRTVFKLNSANFDIKFGEGYIDFVVKGYGHGVGMSQWGAEGMAEEGYKYYDILSHYYTDTKIKDIY